MIVVVCFDTHTLFTPPLAGHGIRHALFLRVVVPVLWTKCGARFRLYIRSAPSPFDAHPASINGADIRCNARCASAVPNVQAKS